MAILSFFQWWYSHGWALFIKQCGERTRQLANFFTIPTLLKTLFKPFRRMAADEKGRGIDGAIMVLIDQLVSRFVGCMTRLVLIICGIIILVLHAAFCLVAVIAWPLLPLAPLGGLFLSLSGVTL